MPTKKKQFSLVVDDQLMDAINDYQFDNRIKNRTTAINQLIHLGIQAILAEEAEKQKAAEAANAAPAAMPENPVEAMTDLLCRVGIIKPGEDISDSDLAFLDAIFSAIEAHFQD